MDTNQQLRDTYYNGTVVGIRRPNSELMILRVRPDFERLVYSAGQYTVLGLGQWESSGSDAHPIAQGDDNRTRLIKRAYSISSAIFDAQGNLARPGTEDDIEFYVSLVRESINHPPGLTPKLFQLSKGDRLYISPHAQGNYTLTPIADLDNVVFAGTGTGEAPHNAMVVELLRRTHRGRIAVVTCVRRRNDLAYLNMHRRLEEQFSNYCYFPLTTREPENLDATHPSFVGKRYIQDFFQSHDFEANVGCPLEPLNIHVFLCGNPAMIGAAHPSHKGTQRFGDKDGMVKLLQQQGFTVDRPHASGNIHFEKYW